MRIDMSQMPLVFARTKQFSTETFEMQFQQVLDREEKFVLISDHAVNDHDNETPEERKQRTLFMKTIRSQMRALCLAMIMVEGDKPIPAATRLTANTASKAFGFKIAFAHTEQDAIFLAQKVIAGTVM